MTVSISNPPKQKIIINKRDPINETHDIGSETHYEEIMLPQSNKKRSSKKSDSSRKYFNDVIMHHYHILNLIS
ncbi:MAG: hypothetical protein ACW99A_01965 [Candidatus Kariarchaeaceae archaeon]|jgi:hypothetical protein